MQFKNLFINFKYFDWLFFVAIVMLFCFGLAALYGLATSFEKPDFTNFQKQIIIGLGGIIILIFLSSLDYKTLKPYAYFFYIANIALLILVIFFGQTLRGTTGWLSIFGFNFQPAELMKVALIILFANYFSAKLHQVSELKFIFTSGLLALIPFSLVALQPDFGSAMMIFFIWFFMIFISGVRRWPLLIILGSLIVCFVFAWFFVFKDYQKDRIMTFLNPNLDPSGRGYQIRQGTIAVGSGQLYGRGLAAGSQSQLKFIPAAHTDFIFTVIAEELGFVGGSLVLLFYFVFFLRVIRAAIRAPDNFGLFLVLGASVMFFCHLFVNIGMNLGIMPVTGISLPFLSYGGSFLLISFILAGLIESVIVQSVKYKI